MSTFQRKLLLGQHRHQCDVTTALLQVITKLLYLLTQGETLTKVPLLDPAVAQAIAACPLVWACAHAWRCPACKYTLEGRHTSFPMPLASQKEASEVFFSVTKLYQSKDTHLRRMVYLVIKDVCPGSDEVIIITSSLMKDMNSKTDLYRSNAIRVLCSITDPQLLGQIERYLKQVRPG